MQHVAVGVGLRAGREAFAAQNLGHHARDLGAAQVGAHRLGARDPVVAAGAFHGLEALVDQDHDSVTMIGLDERAADLVREPGIAGYFADPGDVGAEVVGERLDGAGIGHSVGETGRFAGGDLAVLERQQGADHGELRSRQRVFERKPRPLALRLVAEVALQGALEKSGPLRDPGHLVV